MSPISNEYVVLDCSWFDPLVFSTLLFRDVSCFHLLSFGGLIGLWHLSPSIFYAFF